MIKPPPSVPVPYWVNATVTEWHDGDTVLVVADRGDRDYSTWSIRVLGAACLECPSPGKPGDPGGPETRDECARRWPPGTELVLATVKPDKYGGRHDARVFYAGPGGVPVNIVDELIADGWALPWNGVGKQPKPAWPRVQDA
jgi:endonuclease YncB( thermonuclease family)